MLGLMQQMPLLTSSFIQYADRWHGDREIDSSLPSGVLHRYNYRDAHKRAKKVANVLQRWGVQQGDRIATLAWNTHRHFELYYGIGGSGAVTHTINPRYTPEQITYIVNHAQDSYLFFDITFLALVEAVAPHCPSIKGFVLLVDTEQMPENSSLENLLCYETLLEGVSEEFEWPEFDENSAASLCYTSGTTGNPKGVCYSHRSTSLHTLVASMPNALGIGREDCVLPVVPLFHINAWELPYICTMTGAKLVLPGPNLDGKSLYELMEAEGVTFTAGVPTIWMGLLNHMAENDLTFSTLKKVGTGGSACPKAITRSLHDSHGIQVMHGWGMTETSSVVTLNNATSQELGISMDEYCDLMAMQGPPVWGSDIKVVDEQGQELPHDGSSAGELMVRGHWICSEYYKTGESALESDGWLATGDVAVITRDGYLHLTDRLKDMIKSGGEWISSVELEDIAISHPKVEQAAVIGVVHPKWDERPLLLIKAKAGEEISEDEIKASYDGKIAKWSVPDDVVFLRDLPIGATGKIHKLTLREQFKDHYLDA